MVTNGLTLRGYVSVRDRTTDELDTGNQVYLAPDDVIPARR